jgi:DNA repair exonuclease SbcCD ATPase subunit
MLEFWLPWLVALISAVGGVLAWIAKLRWSQEFAQAKDATIAAKDAEIAAKEAQIKGLERELEFLRTINPKILREYNEAALQSLREFVELLQQKLEEAESRVHQLTSELTDLNATLTTKGVVDREKEIQIERLEHEKRDLSFLVEKLREDLTQLTSPPVAGAAATSEELTLISSAAETAEEIDRALGTDREPGDGDSTSAIAVAGSLATSVLTGSFVVPGVIYVIESLIEARRRREKTREEDE